MSQLVPSVRTTFTPAALIEAIRAAWQEEMGGPSANHCVGVLCAQVALETNNGASCWGWNLGNYKRYGTLDWQALKTWEVVNGVDVPQTCDFAVFPSLVEGSESFVRSQYTHWDLAWHSVGIGDPRGYAFGLYNQKPPYYTADPKKYAAGCEHWFNYYMAIMGGDSAPTLPDLSNLGLSVGIVDVDVDPLAKTDPPSA